jgi:sulfite exporter TauE/SafE
MTALIAAIFLASVLGSLHCAGMCGAFVAIACNRTLGNKPGAREVTVLQVAYNGGRLISYTILGALAGGIGWILNIVGSQFGLYPVAAPLAGAIMIALALVTLMKLGGFHLAALHPPRFFARLLGPAHKMAMNQPPLPRAALIGLFTTLMPCGWLYAFVVTAAGTASPLYGAIAMAVFWAGTLPMLVMVGASARRMLGFFGEHLPAVTCLLLVGVGLYTILTNRMFEPKPAMAETVQNVEK